MHRIAVVTAFWQRPGVSVLYWRGLDRLRKQKLVELLPIAVISPEDDANHTLALAHGAAGIVEAPNHPLAAKWQAGLDCASGFKPQHVMILGSDNLLSDGMFRGLVTAMKAGIVHGGISDMYVWDLPRAKAAYWPGYSEGSPREGHSIGAGRFYDAGVLASMAWELWPRDSTFTSGMDGLAHQRLSSLGIATFTQPMKDWGGSIVDIKSSTNLWKFWRFNKHPIDPWTLFSEFPELKMLRLT